MNSKRFFKSTRTNPTSTKPRSKRSSKSTVMHSRSLSNIKTSWRFAMPKFWKCKMYWKLKKVLCNCMFRISKVLLPRMQMIKICWEICTSKSGNENSCLRAFIIKIRGSRMKSRRCSSKLTESSYSWNRRRLNWLCWRSAKPRMNSSWRRRRSFFSSPF